MHPKQRKSFREWTVLFDEDFALWLDALPTKLLRMILGHVELLETFGPNLGRPGVDGIKGSAYQHEGAEGPVQGRTLARLP